MSSRVNVQRSDWSNVDLRPARSNPDEHRSTQGKNYDDDRLCSSYFKISCCSKALVQGAFVGTILGAIPLLVIIFLWTRSAPKEIVTTLTTATSITSKTTTTTSTTITTTSVTTITSTTSTTTTETSTTSISSTSRTTITSYDSCNLLRWNQTAAIIVGQNGSNLSGDRLSYPICLEIDSKNIMYICDYGHYRIQKWPLNATNATTISNTLTNDRPVDIAISPNKTLYVSYRFEHYVARFTDQPTNGTVVAGVQRTASNSTTHLNYPIGITIDHNYNVYIADTINQRVVKWFPNSTSGTVVISNSAGIRFSDILLVPGTTNQFYLSSMSSNAVYLWEAGLSIPTRTYNRVNSSTSMLNSPRGIKLDRYGNLYVVDSGNRRVVKFCPSSTIGFVAIDGNQSSQSMGTPTDLAFDSDLNLYVVDQENHQIQKFSLY